MMVACGLGGVFLMFVVPSLRGRLTKLSRLLVVGSTRLEVIHPLPKPCPLLCAIHCVTFALAFLNELARPWLRLNTVMFS